MCCLKLSSLYFKYVYGYQILKVTIYTARLTDAHVCEQLVQSGYIKVERHAVDPATS